MCCCVLEVNKLNKSQLVCLILVSNAKLMVAVYGEVTNKLQEKATHVLRLVVDYTAKEFTAQTLLPCAEQRLL